MQKSSAVYLVSCVSQKQDHECAARDLYTSPWFVRARRYVETSGQPWFILSAEHGLVHPSSLIAPYERALNVLRAAERRAWASRVNRDLTAAVPDLSHVVFLAGARYREFLARHLGSRGVAITVPMAGLAIGKQLSWLTKHSP